MDGDGVVVAQSLLELAVNGDDSNESGCDADSVDSADSDWSVREQRAKRIKKAVRLPHVADGVNGSKWHLKRAKRAKKAAWSKAASWQVRRSSTANAHVFLVHMRDVVGVRGLQVKEMADVLMGVKPWSHMATVVTEAKAATGAQAKFVLRKLAAALVDPRKARRHAQWQQFGLREGVSVQENQWCKQDAYEILVAIHSRMPELLCIPADLRTRVIMNKSPV